MRDAVARSTCDLRALCVRKHLSYPYQNTRANAPPDMCRLIYEDLKIAAQSGSDVEKPVPANMWEAPPEGIRQRSPIKSSTRWLIEQERTKAALRLREASGIATSVDRRPLEAFGRRFAESAAIRALPGSLRVDDRRLDRSHHCPRREP
ncbi:unnamed protein product, partial [Iphiclides podalirius]